jgi:hypothetical protein
MKTKIIKCLDGKERIFTRYENENGIYFYYKLWIDNKEFGRVQVIRAENIKNGKFPKHTTKEMLFE